MNILITRMYLFPGTFFFGELIRRGFKWNAERIYRALQLRGWNAGKNGQAFAQCKFGFDIKKVLYNTKSKANAITIEDIYEMGESVEVLPYSIKFLTVDPGRQYIGSFHPVNDKDWENGVYL